MHAIFSQIIDLPDIERVVFAPRDHLTIKPENLFKFVFHDIFEKGPPKTGSGKAGHHEDVQKAVHRTRGRVGFIRQRPKAPDRVM